MNDEGQFPAGPFCRIAGYLEKAIERGRGDYDFIQNDPELATLRETPGFKVLMKRYFQEKVKD